jgi:hypothetical protein
LIPSDEKERMRQARKRQASASDETKSAEKNLSTRRGIIKSPFSEAIQIADEDSAYTALPLKIRNNSVTE